ncbi:MAG: YceI family protein [Gaiellaceae bacterium]|jgi:polyisoprenoid-binding protein YceI
MSTAVTQHQMVEGWAGSHWQLDRAQSSAEFRVEHFWGLITVAGHFDRFDGTLDVDADGTPLIALTIDAASLDTGNATRDRHLRSVDFFAVTEHPEVHFNSSDVTDTDDGVLQVSGELEAAGKRIPISADARLRPLDQQTIEIEATATADHRQLGMTWSPLGMLRPPATLHVKARLARRTNTASAGGDRQ